MIQLLKSEMFKFKGSYQLYIILILSTIQLLTIPIYILSVNNTIVLENIIFLPMLGYCMITTIITLLVSEQEKLSLEQSAKPTAIFTKSSKKSGHFFKLKNKTNPQVSKNIQYMGSETFCVRFTIIFTHYSFMGSCRYRVRTLFILFLRRNS